MLYIPEHLNNLVREQFYTSLCYRIYIMFECHVLVTSQITFIDLTLLQTTLK